MPTYEHVCENGNCNHEWEEEYGIKDPIPSICPSCLTQGSVKRLISGGSGRGIVELTGYDLKVKLKQDGLSLKREALRNDNLKANLVGETTFQQNTKTYERLSSDLSRIKIKSKK